MTLTHSIRSIERLLRVVGSKTEIVLGIDAPLRFEKQISDLGFTIPLAVGETILPKASYGVAATTNAEGWIEVHKDRPMETAHRQVIWRWKMKRGWSYEWDEKLVDVPYKRYPRTIHPPIGLEITVLPKTDGSLLLGLPSLILSPDSAFLIRTGVNLFIEIFGECTVFSTDLDAIIRAAIKRLNWRILPPGKHPWETLEKVVSELIASRPQKTREIIEYRIKAINGYGPEFVAIGTHGFAGYLVFGFPRKRLFLLESIYFGNATYGLSENWETLSKLSKSELLDNALHSFRVIHSSRWIKEIKAAMQ